MDNLDGLIERLRTTRLLSQRNQLALQEEAAATLETITQEVERLREAGWRDIESAPTGKTMFVVIGVTDGNGFTGDRPYTTDPCCVWLNEDGRFARWPHHWPPTHWMPLPPAPARKALGGGDDAN